MKGQLVRRLLRLPTWPRLVGTTWDGSVIAWKSWHYEATNDALTIHPGTPRAMTFFAALGAIMLAISPVAFWLFNEALSFRHEIVLGLVALGVGFLAISFIGNVVLKHELRKGSILRITREGTSVTMSRGEATTWLAHEVVRVDVVFGRYQRPHGIYDRPLHHTNCMTELQLVLRDIQGEYAVPIVGDSGRINKKVYELAIAMAQLLSKPVALIDDDIAKAS